MARNFKLTIEYDGTDYAGWQSQTNALAVQTVIEQAIFRALHLSARLIGAGRTDAGVHAFGQVANFRAETTIPTDGLLRAMNGTLPRDIAIVAVEEVAEDFHARFDARERTYEYHIWNRPTRSALRERFAWHYHKPLSIEVWNALGGELVGKRDFASFRKTGSPRDSSVCDVRECRCFRDGDLFVLRVVADAFLRGMVRAIVGTFRRLAPDDSADAATARRELRRILAAKDRGEAGESAPAQGLRLVKVAY